MERWASLATHSARTGWGGSTGPTRRGSYIHVTFRGIWSRCVPLDGVVAAPGGWAVWMSYRLTGRGGCYGQLAHLFDPAGVGPVRREASRATASGHQRDDAGGDGRTPAGGGLRHPPAQGRRQRAAAVHRAGGGDVPGPGRGPGRQG